MDLAPERQSDGPDADAGTLSSLDMNSRNLEQQLNAAERETAELENELKKLDETFNARLAELNIGIDNAVKLTGTLPVESIETSGLGEIAESPSAPEALAATDTVETLETVEAVEISPQEAILPPSAEALIEANGTEPHPAPQLSRSLRGVANVISLAARIRSQQKKAGD
jgi:hypothetical protein